MRYGTRSMLLALLLAALCACAAGLAEAGVLTLPASLEAIGDEAFYHSEGLDRVIVPEGVREIGARAFAYSGVTQIELPESLTAIAGDAFAGSRLQTVIAAEGSYAYEWALARGYIQSEEAPEPSPLSDFEIVDGVVIKYNGRDSRVVIPSRDADGNPVTEIGDRAFFENLFGYKVVIPEGVTRIGEYAFASSRFMRINIPSSVTSFGKYAFSSTYFGMDERPDIVIPYGVTEIPECLFQYAYIHSVTIPDTVTSIGERAFYDCNYLERVNLPDSVTRIGESAFLGCDRLTRIEVPTSVTDMGYGIFDNCKALTDARIDANISDLPSGLFYNCESLAKVRLPDTLKTVENRAFYNCSALSRVHIPDSVTAIGNSAFYGCAALTEVDGMGGLERLADFAFAKCGALADIALPDGLTAIGAEAFGNCASLRSLSIPASVRSIDRSAFFRCTGLTEMVLPEGLADVGEYIFSNCTGLERIAIPADMKIIPKGMLSGCAALKEVWLPEGMTQIKEYAFDGCASLEAVHFPDTLIYIGEYAFRSCDSLESVVLPGNDVARDRSFFQCTGLRSVVISEGTEIIGVHTFAFCPNLTEISLPNTLTVINGYAFAGCSSLISVRIPNGVTYIGEAAFSNCKSLLSVTLPSSIQYIRTNGINLKTSPNMTAMVTLGSYAETYCRMYNIPYIAMGMPQPGKSELRVAIGAPVRTVRPYDEIPLIAAASGGVAPYEYNYVMSIDGEPAEVSGWVRTDRFGFAATREGVYRVGVVVRDAAGDTAQSSVAMGTVEDYTEAEKQSRAMIEAIAAQMDGVKSPAYLCGMQYYESLNDNDWTTILALMNALKDVVTLNPVDAAERLTFCAKEEYLFDKAISAAVTGNIGTMLKPDVIPDGVRLIRSGADVGIDAYYSALLQMCDPMIISEKALTNADISRAFDQFMNDQDGGASAAAALSGYGVSSENLTYIANNMEYLKKLKTIKDVAGRLSDIQRTVSDAVEIYNQIVLLESLDMEQLSRMSGVYLASADTATHLVGQRLRAFVDASYAERVAMIGAGQFAELGLDRLAGMVAKEIGKTDYVKGSVAAAGVRLTYEVLNAATNVGDLIGAYYQLDYVGDAVNTLWRAFERSRNAYRINPTQAHFRTMYWDFVGYYEMAATVESAFARVVNESEDGPLTCAALIDERMRAMRDDAAANAAELQAICGKLRNLFSDWTAGDYDAFLRALSEEIENTPARYSGGGGGGQGW